MQKPTSKSQPTAAHAIKAVLAGIASRQPNTTTFLSGAAPLGQAPRRINQVRRQGVCTYAGWRAGLPAFTEDS